MSFSALEQREIPATAPPPETNVSELQGRSEAQTDGENVHAEGGVLVAVSRGLTLDSPRETLASQSKLILALNLRKILRVKQPPEPWVRSTW